MNINTKDGWTIVPSRMIAAASAFTNKSMYGSLALNNVQILTKFGITHVNASDSYRAMVSSVIPYPGFTNPDGEFQIDFKELKSNGLITPSPKVCAWLALREVDEHTVECISLEGDRGKCRGTVRNHHERYPDLELAISNHKPKEDKSVIPGESPALNTDYVLDMLMAVKKGLGPSAVTQFTHGSLTDAFTFYSVSDSTNESVRCMCMPIKRKEGRKPTEMAA